MSGKKIIEGAKEALAVAKGEAQPAVEHHFRFPPWLPIETAPKDGTIIIVPGGIAYWLTKPEHGAPGWFTITACDWPGRRIEWEVKHWFPFPDPPKSV